MEEVQTNFQYFTEEYINGLLDPEDIKKPSVFTGLIKYLNRYIVRPLDKQKLMGDINLIDDMWLSYTELVYRYNQKPMIQEFCLLLSISKDTFYRWCKDNTTYNDYCERLNLSRSDTLKTYLEECQLSRYKGASSGNIGDIFLCKAVDGLRETSAPGITIAVSDARGIESLPVFSLPHTDTTES